MNQKVTTLPKAELSIREQAQAEVLEETLEKNKVEMKQLLRSKLAAEQVVRGIDMKIADLEQRIKDGTA